MEVPVRRIAFILFVLLVGLSSFLSAQAPQFSLGVAPATVTVLQGGVSQITVTLGGNIDPGEVDISLSGLPEAVHPSIPATHRGQFGITIAAGSTATVGIFPIRVIASASKSEQSQVFILEVKPMPVVPQWEYTYAIASSEDDLMRAANELGAQSWEMVNVVIHEDVFRAFFKRLKRK